MVQETTTILVVDDSEHILTLMEQMLLQEGYSVITALTGEIALEIFNSQTIDLILLDVIMPGISGLEVLAAVRASKPESKRTVPVIIVSVKSSIEDIDAAIAAEVNSYVVKPFRTEALIERIAQVLDPNRKI
jgi:DNA-binding response OmpR family regulator